MATKKESAKSAETSGGEDEAQDQNETRRSQRSSSGGDASAALPSGDAVDEVVPVGEDPGDTLRRRVVQAGPDADAISGPDLVEVTEDVVEEFQHPGSQRKSHRQLAVKGTLLSRRAAEDMGISSGQLREAGSR